MYSFKIGDLYLPLAQIIPECQLLFESICLVSQYKDICAKALQVLNLFSSNLSAKYASLHCHVLSNKSCAKGTLFLSKSILFVLGVQIGEKELILMALILLLHGEDNDAVNPYFHTMLEKSGIRRLTSNCIKVK